MKYKKIFIFTSFISILLYIIFALYYGFTWYNSLYINEGIDHIKMHNKYVNYCEKYLEIDDEIEKVKFLENNEDMYLDDETCIEYTTVGKNANSALTIYAEYLHNEIYLFPFFIPIIVVIPFIYILSREMSNNILKNYCLRDNYKNYLRHIFKVSYKSIFVIPIVIFLTLLISYIVSGYNLDYSSDLFYHYVLPGKLLLDNKLNWILFFLNLFFASGLYINLGLIVLSKNSNFIIASIETIVSIFLTWCFSNIFIGNICRILFNLNPSNFNLLLLYNWSGVDNACVYCIWNLILFIISFVLVLKMYKSKENIICKCENRGEL